MASRGDRDAETTETRSAAMSGNGAGSEPIKLLEAASWIAEGIARDELTAARQALVVTSATYESGPWTWDRPDPAVGLLILSGRMARVLHVDAALAHGLELVGDGDLLRPWSFRGPTLSIPSRVEWQALSELRIAELDRTFVRACVRWPRLWINLLDASVERTRAFSYFLTARQVTRLELRILLTLWHLADRWGRRGPEGVILDLPKLTHEMLARLVSAQRPSVTTGVKHLRELGVLEVRSHGRWILFGEPIEALRRVQDSLPRPAAAES